ncbi:peptidoglycan-associated lipoprotein Pal [Novosphingobium sp. KCTC 2891]|uniref:peptidoglycan-associated lipoprotein Pal n=1 Tax=Novosphingobium sp. KCTC 2891 TaxID=2989730 RepID=UPI0022225FAB|nr:peptidoglycan-associated lipoprotein Pal [Novosphingobium sp. KCTC 2891]MCW1382657.1 peptidoglycan-associated lipoprotein Pal [Novosphingobium sp. KCTC 2891]
MPALTPTKISALLLAAASLSLGACASKAPKELPPQPTATSTTTMPTQPAGPVPGSQADFLASVLADTIHFDTDRYNVDTEDQGILQSQAQWLARYPAKMVTLEGHCDERGTRDYNIALGERRANAAKNYLVSLGVDASRITVVSYGKERPIALGSDEASWAKNRRAVTITVQ